MYNPNAINYGLSRQDAINALCLNAEDVDVLNGLQEYVMESGYYHTSKMQRESGTVIDFFGNSDDEHKLLDDKDRKIQLAEKFNDAWDKVVSEAQAEYDAKKIKAAIDAVELENASLDDMEVLVKAGIAYKIYSNQPEDELPTYVIGTAGDKNPYKDNTDEH